MDTTNVNVVVSTGFIASRKKNLKTFIQNVKKVFKCIKTRTNKTNVKKVFNFIKIKTKDSYLILIKSEKFLEFKKTPLKSAVFKDVILPKLGLGVLIFINYKTMSSLESRIPSMVLNVNPDISKFSQSSRTLKLLYGLDFCIKISFLVNSCNTLRATPLLISQFFITYSDKSKSFSVITRFFNKGKLLNACYVLSIELKIVDFIYFNLILINGTKVVKQFIVAKFLRETDFAIFILIIILHVVYFILDSINLNSRKK